MRTVRLLLGQRGTSIIEVAIVFPVLMLVVLGIFDFSRMFYCRLTMQHAVREAVRFAVTGNTTLDQDGKPRARADAIKTKIQENAMDLDVEVDKIVISPSNGGGPGEVVTVQAGFSYEFLTPLIEEFFPNGRYDFTVSSSMKNEPFSTS
jgi:Flp pilus assembly protein TadG